MILESKSTDMADNIVTKLMDRLNIESFIKINPNTEKEERPNADKGAGAQQFEQAAVTAVLAGMYKYGSTDEGAKNLYSLPPESLLHELFLDHKEDVVQGLAAYGSIHAIQAESVLNTIVPEAVHAVREAVGADAKPEAIRSYLAGQRHNILVYLPPDLHFGKLVGDDILDDRTNKMEGPVSGFMHFIENLFSEKDTDKASHPPGLLK